MKNEISKFIMGIGLCVVGLMVLFSGRNVDKNIKEFNENAKNNSIC